MTSEPTSDLRRRARPAPHPTTPSSRIPAARALLATASLAAALLLTGCVEPASDDASSGAEAAEAPAAQASDVPVIEFGLVVHGGAGGMTPDNTPAERQEAVRAGMTEALEAGYAVLADGGSALDAVVATINVMEDSPHFNAGKGAVFTHDGRNSLDASIMDGSTLQAGAVAGVGDVRNPIDLARLVMESSPHVMLSGEGAETFAREHGIPSTPQDYFYTERRWEALQDALAEEEEGEPMGTVGAIALDRDGNLAAGTSTGGMTNKRWDRIGDSPIIGAGTYASADCGISATGWGEYFIRNVVAYDICARKEYKGISLARAAHEVVMERLEAQQENTGGIVGLDSDGHVVMPFNTSGMNRGWVDQDGKVTVAIFPQGG